MPGGKLFAIVLPIALGIVMIGAGAVNFVGPKSVRDSFVRWGYPASFHRVTGRLEAIAGLLLLVPATSWAGAIGSVVILVAAVITLIRHREGIGRPFATQSIIVDAPLRQGQLLQHAEPVRNTRSVVQ